LRPITETIPKALIPIAGKPFIHHQLNYLFKQGIRHVVLCIGYLGEMVKESIGDGANFGLNVKYSFDGKQLLGTGGAIKKSLPMLSKDFYILYGDSFLPINFAPIEKAFLDSNKLGLMTVLKNHNQWDSSNVIFQNGQLLEYNKLQYSPLMDYIDYGLGILNQSVFDKFPDNEAFDLADVYNELSLENQLEGYEVFDRFYEIGSIAGIKDTEKFFIKVG
jgi:NDP-sugar pyrophosphorylase family protein